MTGVAPYIVSLHGQSYKQEEHGVSELAGGFLGDSPCRPSSLVLENYYKAERFTKAWGQCNNTPQATNHVSYVYYVQLSPPSNHTKTTTTNRL